MVNCNGVTLNAQGAPLAEVITAVGREAGIRVVIDGSLDENVSLRLADVALVQTLRRLTRNLNCAFFYEGPQVRSLFVYQRITDDMPSPDGNAIKALLADLFHPDPQERERSVEKIAARTADETVVRDLTEFLINDPELVPKASAMAALGDFADPLVKIGVVRALGQIGGPKAMTYLQKALEDDDTDVRLVAAQTLSWLNRPIVPAP